MRSIAIVLNDNDFGSTFEPLLDSIYNLLIYRGGNIDETETVIAIKEGIRYHYVAFQLCNRIRSTSNAEIDQTVHYLKTRVTILFDEDAEKDWMVNDRNSGAWFLEVATGKVDRY